MRAQAHAQARAQVLDDGAGRVAVGGERDAAHSEKRHMQKEQAATETEGERFAQTQATMAQQGADGAAFAVRGMAVFEDRGGHGGGGGGGGPPPQRPPPLPPPSAY